MFTQLIVSENRLGVNTKNAWRIRAFGVWSVLDPFLKGGGGGGGMLCHGPAGVPGLATRCLFV